MGDAPPRWPYRGELLSHAEAVALQAAWRTRVRASWRGSEPELVAGVDVSVRQKRACAVVAVCDAKSFELVESVHALRPAEWPYLPGLLSFREVPAILEAFAKLERQPDLLFVDGHGRAHPRRFGVACHLGVELGLPAIGVGKSRFVGEHRAPAAARGSRVRLEEEGELLGKVVRTRDGVKPLYVSVGHAIDLERAVRWVLRAAKRTRLPEPIRAADRLAGELNRSL